MYNSDNTILDNLTAHYLKSIFYTITQNNNLYFCFFSYYMERFQVIQPSAHLAPYVKQYWFISATDITKGYQRAIPSGYTGLVFNRGKHILPVTDNHPLPKAYIFGQILTPVTHTFSDTLDLIIVIFQAAGARAFFRILMDEIFGMNVPLDSLNDKRLTELGNRLINCTDNLLCIYWIESYLSKYLLQTDSLSDRFNMAVNSINMGERNIQKLAEQTCLGYKQFKRLFKTNIGLNPKEYIRIIRCSSTLRQMLINPATSLEELAFTAGYYDKSHLIKEVKSFSGYTPSEYQMNSDPYSDYKALFQSVFIDVKQ